MRTLTPNADASPESPYAWLRLAVSVLLSSIGSVGMWSVVVALPAVQAEFASARAGASLPYTLAMVGFGLGAVVFGRLIDRLGMALPAALSAIALSVGFVASAFSPNLTTFAIVNFVIGFGSSATFAPILADISHWFTRRRGIAVSVCAAGNYVGGAIWPPVVQHLIAAYGWRGNQIIIGVFCLAAMLPLVLVLRRRLAHGLESDAAQSQREARAARVPLSPNALFALLCVAGVSCCVAMAMPQVHIVAYCADLGYGVANGANMLALMLGFGIVSRVASGFVADRIGGLATLMIGSVLQGLALFLYLLADGLAPLYVISALFGLFQGGIVPMYAVICRDYFPPEEAGARVSTVITSSIAGMALGGWLSGVIFDLTGSYWQAFANGLIWNLVNLSIVVFLFLRARARPLPA
ncbi:MAG: MFS transporter [Hyphomicrobiaceae bacterium]|nr:MFS transporter [Hyphomicrobiaceae bacterium]